VRSLQAGDGRGVGDERDHEKPVRAVGSGKDVEGAAAAVLALDVEEHQVVVGGRQDLHHAAHAFHGRRAGEERDDDADHHRPAERQVPRHRARPVVELADRRRHPFAGGGGDVGAVVQDA